jgi:peptide deformylase
MINDPPRPNALLDSQYISAAFELPVVVWPDKRLTQKCEEVTEFDDQLRTFVASMIATMRKEDGVGLAAPQVGILKNIITIDIPMQRQLPSQGTETPSYESVERPFVLINPKITDTDEKPFAWREGCLSVPGYYEDRERPWRIVVEYFNDDGKKYTHEFTNLFAFAIQHEIDHLEGKLFIDDLSRLKLDRIRKKITKTLNRRL